MCLCSYDLAFYLYPSKHVLMEYDLVFYFQKQGSASWLLGIALFLKVFGDGSGWFSSLFLVLSLLFVSACDFAMVICMSLLLASAPCTAIKN